MPLDQGFNRLAWAVPYALGLFGAAFAGGLAVRWSRRPHSEQGDGGEGGDADVESQPAPDAEAEALRARLDEELRDLD